MIALLTQHFPADRRYVALFAGGKNAEPPAADAADRAQRDAAAFLRTVRKAMKHGEMSAEPEVDLERREAQNRVARRGRVPERAAGRVSGADKGHHEGDFEEVDDEDDEEDEDDEDDGDDEHDDEDSEDEGDEDSEDEGDEDSDEGDEDSDEGGEDNEDEGDDGNDDNSTIEPPKKRTRSLADDDFFA
mgnify:CR=1 FL=1